MKVPQHEVGLQRNWSTIKYVLIKYYATIDVRYIMLGIYEVYVRYINNIMLGKIW